MCARGNELSLNDINDGLVSRAVECGCHSRDEIVCERGRHIIIAFEYAIPTDHRGVPLVVSLRDFHDLRRVNELLHILYLFLQFLPLRDSYFLIRPSFA